MLVLCCKSLNLCLFFCLSGQAVLSFFWGFADVNVSDSPRSSTCQRQVMASRSHWCTIVDESLTQIYKKRRLLQRWKQTMTAGLFSRQFYFLQKWCGGASPSFEQLSHKINTAPFSASLKYSQYPEVINTEFTKIFSPHIQNTKTTQSFVILRLVFFFFSGFLWNFVPQIPNLHT